MANKFVFCLSLEIEAKEACDWLRVTGFPQYAQLYEGKARMPSYLSSSKSMAYAAHLAAFSESLLKSLVNHTAAGNNRAIAALTDSDFYEGEIH